MTEVVTIAYVHDETVSHSWHQSLMGLVAYDLSLGNESRVREGGWVAVRCGTDGLPDARNKAVAQFLMSGVEWMCWFDTDMGFEPDVLERLCEAADATERPIVGALTFAWKEAAPDGLGGYRCMPRPVILDWKSENGIEGFQGRATYPPESLVQCAGTGSACILIHRSVFERIRDEFGEVWYTRIPNPSTGVLTGEDLSFCMRAGGIGVPVFVHTGIPTTHHKAIWVGEPDYFAYTVGGAYLEDLMRGERQEARA
jgi:hypothetical protein